MRPAKTRPVRWADADVVDGLAAYREEDAATRAAVVGGESFTVDAEEVVAPMDRNA